MQITDHVYSTHIQEDPSTFGAMHPGGTQIYFVGDPAESMVMIDSGEPYRFWTRQVMDYWAELGSPEVELHRSQTIMEGARTCDFRYRMKSTKPPSDEPKEEQR